VRTLLRLFLILLLAFSAWLAVSLFLPTAPPYPDEQHTLVFPPGTSAITIAARLKDAGVIRSEYAFLVLHGLRHRRLKAGEYAFLHPASALEIYQRLARGDVFVHTVVIPEGFNIFNIADALARAGVCSREEFLQVAQHDTALISDLDPQAPSLEGYLFPDTYGFSRRQTPHEMAEIMVRRFRQEAREIGLTSDVHRVVTLASIVEKETSLPEERPVVASVMLNRLARNMGLNTDPSVIYASLLAHKYDGTIRQSDLHLDSPYNTYKYAGMPPGPIANPGRSSLQAAMHPAQTDYLYFVANNHGGHNFSSTIEEHDRNVALYRRGLKQR
jgi:UPF0755 protein